METFTVVLNSTNSVVFPSQLVCGVVVVQLSNLISWDYSLEKITTHSNCQVARGNKGESYCRPDHGKGQNLLDGVGDAEGMAIFA